MSEIKRLHEVNQKLAESNVELLEALKELVALVQELPVITDYCKSIITSGATFSIAKATNQQGE